MKISQTINTIIKNITFLIETRQRNFTNIISFNFMQFTLIVFIFCLIKFLLNKATYSLCFIFLITVLLITYTF